MSAVPLLKLCYFCFTPINCGNGEFDEQEKRYRSMQEHIRRAHPEHYIPKLPATEESFQLMINTPPSERPPPPPTSNLAPHGLYNVCILLLVLLTFLQTMETIDAPIMAKNRVPQTRLETWTSITLVPCCQPLAPQQLWHSYTTIRLR